MNYKTYILKNHLLYKIITILLAMRYILIVDNLS